MSWCHPLSLFFYVLQWSVTLTHHFLKTHITVTHYYTSPNSSTGRNNSIRGNQMKNAIFSHVQSWYDLENWSSHQTLICMRLCPWLPHTSNFKDIEWNTVQMSCLYEKKGRGRGGGIYYAWGYTSPVNAHQSPFMVTQWKKWYSPAKEVSVTNLPLKAT